MKKSPLAGGDYFDEMDHRKREAIHAALAELASAGVVEVTWSRFQEGRQMEKVYLNFDTIPRAYELAGLVSGRIGFVGCTRFWLPWFPLGDMDYGGIRIFEYIKRNFFLYLRPYLMDVFTYKRSLQAGISFGDEYAAKLTRLAANPACVSWRPLLEVMLRRRKWIEQESLLLFLPDLSNKAGQPL